MLEFKKIDLPFATDMIAEKFDDILELISPNAFVYGGALRDIVAGLTLEGDLDIVAAGKDYDLCIMNIGNSGKWRSKHKSVNTIIKNIRQPTYASNKAINRVSTFETFGNRQVEIIEAKVPFPENYITAALEVIKTVDIRCCGIAMDRYGNVYEMLKGARQDCLDRVLKLNNLNSNSNIENLKNRIAKLEKRGWISRINIKRASKTLNKIKEVAHKEYLERMSKMKIDINEHGPRILASNKGDYLLITIEGINTNRISPTEFKRIIGEIIYVGGYKVDFKINVNRKSSMFLEFRGVDGALSHSELDKLTETLIMELDTYFKYKCERDGEKSIRKGGVIKKQSIPKSLHDPLSTAIDDCAASINKSEQNEPRQKHSYTKYTPFNPKDRVQYVQYGDEDKVQCEDEDKVQCEGETVTGFYPPEECTVEAADPTEGCPRDEEPVKEKCRQVGGVIKEIATDFAVEEISVDPVTDNVTHVTKEVKQPQWVRHNPAKHFNELFETTLIHKSKTRNAKKTTRGIDFNKRGEQA
jgi:hypothetical protein